MEAINVLLVEDDLVWVNGIKAYLAKHKDICVVNQVVNGEESIELVQQRSFDVILMDIFLHGDMDGIQATREITSNSDSKVIILSFLTEENAVLSSFEAGAINYVLKSCLEDLPQAIREACAENPPVNPRVSGILRNQFKKLSEMNRDYEKKYMLAQLTVTELNILKLQNKGLKRKELAQKLVSSERTVQTHISNILKKTEFKNSKQVVNRMLELGILQKGLEKVKPLHK